MLEKHVVVKRMIWAVKCECGWRKEWVFEPPKEIHCAECKKSWLVPVEHSYESKEYDKGIKKL